MEHIKLENDYLDRGRYARSLCRIIADYGISIEKKPGFYIGDNINKEDVFIRKPLNSTDNKAFIMAVSAPWGYGKTTFMQMLKNVLTGGGIESGLESFDKNSFMVPDEVTVYNTWENDFYDNPLEPFVKALIKTVLHEQSEARLSENGIKAFGNAFMEAGQETASKSFQNQNDNDLPSAKIGKAAADFIVEYFKRTKDIQSAIDTNTLIKEIVGDETTLESQLKEMKKLIFAQVKRTKNKKIVIIIDELDRCKPTFAVRTLEIVKHLFNIPGIVYVFSLDITQLQHCVKTVYGNEFDAVGYLERFFDYTTLLPQGNLEDLFDKTLKEFDIKCDQVTEESQSIKGETDEDGTSAEKTSLNRLETQAHVYYQICTKFQLSVREIRAICSSFHYLERYELQNYPEHAKQLYFYLLILKYKEPIKVMSALADSNSAKEIRKELIKDYKPIFKPSFSTSFFNSIFEENPIIGEFKDYVLLDRQGERAGGSIRYTFPPVDQKPDERGERMIDVPVELSDGKSLSYALYAADVDNKEDIRNFHLLEYLFRKVELYDTALPSDSVGEH